MSPLTEERVRSLTRHVMTAGGLGSAGVSLGTVKVWGIPLEVFGGLLIFVAGCVNAWFSKPAQEQTQ